MNIDIQSDFFLLQNGTEPLMSRPSSGARQVCLKKKIKIKGCVTFFLSYLAAQSFARYYDNNKQKQKKFLTQKKKRRETRSTLTSLS
jgi:hypothetical protein